MAGTPTRRGQRSSRRTFPSTTNAPLCSSWRTGGLGILIVVHELPIALAIADHVYVMAKGRMVFDGSPRELEQRRDVQERYIGVGV